MSDIDWSKAPEGATHVGFIACDEQFYRIPAECGKEYDFWSRVAAKWRGNTGKPMADELFQRPTTPQWNGTGLPPVGCACEYQRNDVRYKQAWVEVTPLYLGESITVLRHKAAGNEFTERTSSCVFRPIRTPEQIAAEDREAAISEMTQFFMNYYGNPKAAEQYFLICRSLYDAGYRKQEQTK